MNVRVVVIDVGGLPYSEAATAVLQHYFGHKNIPLSFIKENPYPNVHPSWLKLLVHRQFKEEFIITWDLDLLPVIPFVTLEWDYAKLNLAWDSSLLVGVRPYNRHFKYNCGLIGIPKTAASWLEEVFEKNIPGTLPSYEQYYVNNYIAEHNVSVKELPNSYNTLYIKSDKGQALWKNALCRHYTHGMMDLLERKKMIQQHADNYFSYVK